MCVCVCVCVCVRARLFNQPQRTEYNARSIFKQSNADLNSEFFLLLDWLSNQV